MKKIVTKRASRSALNPASKSPSKPPSKSAARHVAPGEVTASAPTQRRATRAVPVPPVEPAVARAAAATPVRGAKLLSAGIKALTSAHEEAVARQSRVFESLLGIAGARQARDPAHDPAGAERRAGQGNVPAALDPFGFRKFEDVFDQRVANALLHLGVPTAEAFTALTAEVEQLRATVARLEAEGKR